VTQSPSTPAEPLTRLIPAAEVLAAFAAGGSFIETPQYRVGLARREGPGDAEIHDTDTDIFYIFEGAAVLVTGGQMVEPRTVEPNEVRAASTLGGEARTVSKGDIIVIPRTIPHWFKEVTEAPFIYLVVKSTAL
jgi:mannose-6-phosphate isomerase-like protein (cupin superfamily)